eukprot:Hpha_TRINITY_DN15532_c3_g7::TRINITY_DN15532_c3_g7_i1::g.109071::m.109071
MSPVFSLLLAADVHGVKLNFEVPFTAPPTLAELRHVIDAIFVPEFNSRRPPHVPPQAQFSVDLIQVFDEGSELWVDLVSGSQLKDGAQVYVFQHESEFHREVQSKLPPATPLSPRNLHMPPPIRAASVISSVVSGPAAEVPFLPINLGHQHYALAPPPPPPLPPSFVPISHSPPPPAPAVSLAPAPPPASALRALRGSEVRGQVVDMRPHTDVPHGEKLGLVFEQFAGGSPVNLEAWHGLFSRLRVELERSAVADLFTKADIRCDGVVTADEFSMFAERYPTLINALHFRARELWIDARQREGIVAARRLSEGLRTRQSEAQQAVETANQETQTRIVALQTQRETFEASQLREQEAGAAAERSRHATERARQDCNGLLQGVSAAREVGRQRQHAVDVARAEVENARIRAQASSADVDRGLEKLRDIERLLKEQQQVVENQRQEAARAATEVTAAQRSEHAAELQTSDAVRQVQVAEEALAIGEKELKRAQEREREAALLLLEVREGCGREHASVEDCAAQVAVSRAREDQKKAEETEAQRAVEAQDKVVSSLEAENLERNVKRLRTEDEEKPLVFQEVTLRAQRASLEEKEAELRCLSGDFTERTRGRASVPLPAGPFRPPSTSPRRTIHPHPSPVASGPVWPLLQPPL